MANRLPDDLLQHIRQVKLGDKQRILMRELASMSKPGQPSIGEYA